ncbi:MAG: fatty acid CoA ligase family protein [Opitutaceae bacterium]
MTDNANIARHLGAMAAARPEAAALKIPRGRTAAGGIDYLTLTFAELDAEAAAWSARLRQAGVRRGDTALLMVRPGLPLIACSFALFRLGAVPVVIDPGMGLRHFLGCVRRTRPRALVGIAPAQFASRVFRSAFAGTACRVWVPSSLTARLPPGGTGEALAENGAGDLAAILFTSGSTGPPKGVRYEHGMFAAQVALLQSTYRIASGEIDLPMLPIFSLFNPALGMTTIVPEIDPRRPAAVDPARIVRAVLQEQVTNSFGSPTLWRIVADHCRRRGLALPSLRRVLCAGAPVPDALWDDARTLLPNGELHSPYGATEALPVSTLAASERASLRGKGACVGRPVAGIRVKVIALSDSPIGFFDETSELPRGTVGEIVVEGSAVTREYDRLPEATAAAKIHDRETGEVWHRMGDCGYLDDAGRIWFCGRKAERVRTAAAVLYTEPCERVFRRHPRASRCALVGIGEPNRQMPALVVESRTRSRTERRRLASELRALGRADPDADSVRLFYFRSRLPVDVRHNAKIHRLDLARWASKKPPAEAPD